MFYGNTNVNLLFFTVILRKQIQLKKYFIKTVFEISMNNKGIL